jgi:hypothetical protein
MPRDPKSGIYYPDFGPGVTEVRPPQAAEVRLPQWVNFPEDPKIDLSAFKKRLMSGSGEAAQETPHTNDDASIHFTADPAAGPSPHQGLGTPPVGPHDDAATTPWGGKSL